MIKIIKDNQLEDFELKISYLVTKDSGWSYNLETFFIDTMVDIGHSDRTVTFDTKE